MNENMEAYQEKGDVLKELSHPHRLCIVCELLAGPCNVSHLQESLQLSQSAVSQHLMKLRAYNIIIGRRQRNEIYYEVINPIALDVVKVLFGEPKKQKVRK